MMRHYALIVLACLAMVSLSACAPSSASNEQATFKAVPLKGDLAITFSTTGSTDDTLMIDITSPKGIGSAAIEKTAGQWPPQVVMRLRVNGLESFEFHYGDAAIDVSVSSQGDNAVRETVEQSGKTDVINADDSHWIAVTPGEGYFDLEAPADFLKGGENKFTIEWIDFYR